jgi:hypothetical protein
VTHKIGIGDRFGSLVVEDIRSRGAGQARWITCTCDCGKSHSSDAGRLTRGITKRCPSCANPKIYSTFEYRRRQNFHNYRNGACRRGYEWNLSIDQFLYITDKPCDYCGIVPAKGIDRQDNSQGYLPDNSVPCCKPCNLAKRDMSKTEFLNWVARIAAKQGFSL